MSTIVTRAGKGSPLTHNEVDANFNNLNTDKAEVGSANTFTAAQTISNQLNLTNASNYNLYASGAGANYMAGSLGIGSVPSAGVNVNITKTITGAINSYGVASNGQTQSDVTSIGGGFYSGISTQATAFTLSSARAYMAANMTIGAGSTVTNQIGYWSGALSGATNNYAFQGTVTAATGAYNLYMSGTAANYLAGSLGIGTPTLTDRNLGLGKTITGGTTAFAVIQNGVVQSDVTAAGYGFRNTMSTAAASFTLSTYLHYQATQGTIGAGSAITNQYGFFAESALTSATNNYGYYGNIAAATGRYNLYMNGTALNYLAGALGIGTTSVSADVPLTVNLVGTGVNTNGIRANQTIPATSTSTHKLFQSIASTAASAFTLTTLSHYEAFQSTIGAGSAVTSQYGFIAQSNLTGATNNYGFYGAIASGTGRYNIYMAGTAANYFGGDMQFNKTVTASGTTGAQTISKNAGTVNFAAAATSLVVTNTLVTANSIIICTVGTNDTTMKSASAVAAAGSFTIFSNAAATAETRVNFIVIN